MSPALYLEMSAAATRDPQIATVLRESDQAIFDDLQGWMARDRNDGGLALPPEIASRRARLLMQVWSGLAVSAARNPQQDPDVMQAVIENFVSRLVLP
jgi:hypothetical protein